MLTPERLREVLHYCEETGRWTWRVPPNWRFQIGDEAGSINHSGYRKIRIDGRFYLSSRLAFLFMRGSWPKHEIDHKNRDRSDDSWDNLREATRAQNNWNQGVRKDSFSGFKGVSIRRHRGVAVCWRVQIQTIGNMRRTDCYGSLADAVSIYESWARELYGEFARVE